MQVNKYNVCVRPESSIFELLAAPHRQVTSTMQPCAMRTRRGHGSTGNSSVTRFLTRCKKITDDNISISLHSYAAHRVPSVHTYSNLETHRDRPPHGENPGGPAARWHGGTGARSLSISIPPLLISSHNPSSTCVSWILCT